MGEIKTKAPNMTEIVNQLISQGGILAPEHDNYVNTNDVSDGYHTFAELYEHRIILFIALCKLSQKDNRLIWRSKKHSDGSEWDGWFLLGINERTGKQITYHLPSRFWEECEFAYTKEVAPDFDGHTSKDVLDRIKLL